MKKLLVLLLLFFVPIVFGLTYNEQLACFTFDDDETDSTGNFTPTVVGATHYADDHCKLDGCYYFDGANDYINLTDIDLGNPFTISFWINYTDSDARMVLVKWSGADDDYDINYQFQYYSNQLYFKVGNCASTGAFPSPPFNGYVNLWTHVVATYDGATVREFFNGAQAESAAFSQTPCQSDKETTLGIKLSSAGNWEGYIDDLSFWNRNLTLAEIAELYNGGDGATACESESPPAATPTVNWMGYPPYNNSIVTTATLPWFFNVSDAGCEYSTLYNGTTTFGSKLSGTPKDTKDNISNSLSMVDGNYAVKLGCVNNSIEYNSTLKYVTYDSGSPTLLCIYPNCDNSTIHINNTAMIFQFNISDSNPQRYNITIYRPDDSVFFSNASSDYETESFAFVRTQTLDQHGTWYGFVTATDNVSQSATTWFEFYSNAPPIFNISIPDMSFTGNSTISWENQTHVIDADGDSLNYWINNSKVTISGTGLLYDSADGTDNGNWSILVTAGDGYSNVTDEWFYFVNISVTETNTTLNNTLTTGSCPTTTAGVMVLGIFVVFTIFFLYMGFTKHSLSGAMGSILMWADSWVLVGCHSFMSYVIAMLGIILFVYFIFVRTEPIQ